jgi:hypothetical protein
LTNEEGEVRELTEEDFARAIPFFALPAELQALLSEEMRVVPEVKTSSTREPAA